MVLIYGRSLTGKPAILGFRAPGGGPTGRDVGRQGVRTSLKRSAILAV